MPVKKPTSKNKPKTSPESTGKSKKEKTEMDLMTHYLVPKHYILTQDEKKALLAKYNITEEQLPKILTKDPVVKQIGAKPGDVVKIVRDSPTAGESLYFRLVVERS